MNERDGESRVTELRESVPMILMADSDSDGKIKLANNRELIILVSAYYSHAKCLSHDTKYFRMSALTFESML